MSLPSSSSTNPAAGIAGDHAASSTTATLEPAGSSVQSQLLTLTTDRLTMEINMAEDAAQVRVILTDLRTQRTWRSGLCELDVMWDALQRDATVNDLAIVRYEQISSTSLHVHFGTALSRVGYVMAIHLHEHQLRVSVAHESLKENRGRHYRVFGIRPLPGLMMASGEDLAIAPLGAGALIRPAACDHPFEDSLLIYGEQHRWEDLPLIPVAGIYHQNHNGVCAIVESGECDTRFEVNMPGDKTIAMNMCFRYRTHWPDAMDDSDRTLCFTFLDAESADYSGIARELRAMFQRVHGVTTLRQKAAVNSDIDYIARALVVKTFHGMKELGNENGDGTYRRYQPFKETEQQLRKLKAAGIDNVYVQLVGWNIDGHDGQYPERFPVDPRLGGEEGMRKLIRTGQSLGYQMQVHDNFADSTDPDHPAVIRNLWGGPLARGIWGGGAIYAMNPLKISEKWMRGQMELIRDLGIAGVYYLDAMSPPLEVDYDSKAPGSRRAHAQGMAKVLSVGREIFGAVGTECPFAHIAIHADYVASAPLKSIAAKQRRAKLLDFVERHVPVWHIAFHGLVVHALNDSPYPCVDALLQAAETGSVPRSDFSGQTPEPGVLMATQWSDDLLPAYKAKYDILIGGLGDNVFAMIQRHEQIGEQAFLTTFDNGSVVEVDYLARTLIVNGQLIEIPEVIARKQI